MLDRCAPSETLLVDCGAWFAFCCLDAERLRTINLPTMILKQKDALDEQVQRLEHAIKGLGPGRERQRLEKDLAAIRAGAKGEEEAAYHIDFHLKDSPNWAVIHDLRIEWNGRVAQIDHLLIDRFLEVYVVESKSFRTKIRHANGGWERLNFSHWEGIPSPVEQNERHIVVLKELIDELGFAPTRLGIVLQPVFFNFVVVQPSCSIMGSVPKAVNIHRMDELVAVIRRDTPSAVKIMKVVSSDTLVAFASHLVACHKPAPHPEPLVNAVNAAPKCSSPGASATEKCQGCGGKLSTAEADFCLERKARFAGQVLCRKCQKLAPQRMLPQDQGDAPNASKSAAQCVECGTAVDSKVLLFCRINAEKFARRILCRNCQRLAAPGTKAIAR